MARDKELSDLGIAIFAILSVASTAVFAYGYLIALREYPAILNLYAFAGFVGIIWCTAETVYGPLLLPTEGNSEP